MSLTDDQMDRLRTVLTAAGVKWQCPACNEGRLTVARALFALPEVAPGYGGAATGSASAATGSGIACAATTCETCGYVRLHSLAALGTDGMP